MYTIRTAQRAFLLPLLGICLTPFIVSADLVIYTSGSADAGLTGDATQAFTLRDASLTESSPDTAYGGAGNNNVQLSGTSVIYTSKSYSLYSFDGLLSGTEGSKIGSGADINSARLNLFQNGNSLLSGTLTIRGLSTGASDWNEGTATWNNKDSSGTGWDGAGGTIDTALSGSYGTYNFSDGNSGWVPIDLTAALQAYADGTIGGIVLTTDSTGPFTRPLFSVDSKENPSGNSAVLRVDQIPEPAVASFMLIGSAAFYVVRRMKRSEAEDQVVTL